MAKTKASKTEEQVYQEEVAQAKAEGMSPAGIAVLGLGRSAVQVAAANDFVGVQGFGNKGAAIKKLNDGTKKPKEKDGELVKNKDGSQAMVTVSGPSGKARKAASNKIQPKLSPGGSLYKLALAGGPAFDKLKAAAKDAADDMATYGPNTKAFLELLAAGSGGVGGGGSRFSESAVADYAKML